MNNSMYDKKLKLIAKLEAQLQQSKPHFFKLWLTKSITYIKSIYKRIRYGSKPKASIFSSYELRIPLNLSDLATRPDFIFDIVEHMLKTTPKATDYCGSLFEAECREILAYRNGELYVTEGNMLTCAEKLGWLIKYHYRKVCEECRVSKRPPKYTLPSQVLLANSDLL